MKGLARRVVLELTTRRLTPRLFFNDGLGGTCLHQNDLMPERLNQTRAGYLAQGGNGVKRKQETAAVVLPGGSSDYLHLI